MVSDEINDILDDYEGRQKATAAAESARKVEYAELEKKWLALAEDVIRPALQTFAAKLSERGYQAEVPPLEESYGTALLQVSIPPARQFDSTLPTSVAIYGFRNGKVTASLQAGGGGYRDIGARDLDEITEEVVRTEATEGIRKMFEERRHPDQ